MNSNFPFKFSVIVAVYNVEKYLPEAINSILEQNIGFQDCVELILVDDGSPDNSGKICDKYKEKYPTNIKVIHKPNGGVSSARNEGLKHAQGRYISFLDADDKISPDTLSRVYDYFSSVDQDVDLVSIPLYFFEGKEGSHRLNYKYERKDNRIVDLSTDYSFVQMSGASSFFKNQVLQSRRFDTSLKYSEDAKLIMDILLDNPRYGIVPEASYYYRVRNNFDSATNTCWQKKDWYLDHMKHYVFWTIQEAEKRCHKVPLFIQFALMYEMQGFFRMKELPTEVLSPEELNEFTDLLKKALDYIDASIIMEQRDMSMEQKDNAIHMKASSGNGTIIYKEEDAYIQYNTIATRPMSVYTAKVTGLDVQNDQLIFCGSAKINTRFPEPSEIFLRITSSGKTARIPCEFRKNPQEIFTYAGKPLALFWDFKGSIPLSMLRKPAQLNICLICDSHVIKYRKISKREDFHVSPSLKENHVAFKWEEQNFYLNHYRYLNQLKYSPDSIRKKLRKHLF